MIHAIGYAGVCLGLPERSISRTARLRNATPNRLHELIEANLTDLPVILAYNVEHHFCLFRINQGIIPFASHPVNTIPWWHEYANELQAIGRYVAEHGLRVSMHPGQYTVLNSENPEVVDNSLAELAATCRILDSMGLERRHKMVLHGGTGKPDKCLALARFEAVWPRVPENVRARLVLENDERIFNVDDLLPVCRRLGLPLVFDRLHHFANPGARADRPVADIVADVVATWHPEDGLPKLHFSSQDPEKRMGAHAYWLDAEEFVSFRDEVSAFTVDVMAECKGKDLALLRLREELDWDILAC